MDDDKYMQRALRLAERGRGRVEPNPVVGCVLVRRGGVVGEGYHHRFGGPHAEVEALRAAGSKARGATAYVTLEPCCHHGKTPPCADALIAAGVSRVVVACVDPFPKVSGGGIRKLRRAGIDVTVGVMEREATDQNAPFFKLVSTGLPWVIAKWAATIDGSIATAAGDSRWISNERSREVVHRLRARVDAVLVGIGTALVDDPQLTARDVTRRRIARRVVIDPSLRLPVDSKLIATVNEAPLTVAASESLGGSRAKRRRELESRGVEVLALPPLGDGLDLKPLMRHLAGVHAVTNVLAEGGGRTLGALAGQGLVDEWLVFIGPRVLGDGLGIRAVGPVPDGRAVTKIADGAVLRVMECRRLGDDVMLRYRRGVAG